MYSRSTDRGGRRIKLPPGYDGSAFRHDTGEIRRFGGDTEMKIHSPAAAENTTEAVDACSDDGFLYLSHREPDIGNRRILSGQWRELPEKGDDLPEEGTAESAAEENGVIPAETWGVEAGNTCSGKGNGSLLEGLLGSLGSEDWLLFLVILLLVADGSDAWDLILLLGVLLAVK